MPPFPFARRACFALCLLCSACASTPPRAVVPAQEFRFGDGGTAIFYTLDKAPWSAVPQPEARPRQLLFVLPGSGCRSMGRWLPDYFTGLEGEAGAIRVFILHKRHIAPDADGRQCSEAFIRADHPSRWLADQLEFITQQLAQAGPLQRVLLLGISEGAELAPQLAQRIPAVTHVALLSHSGQAPLELYRELAHSYPDMQQGWLALQQALATAPADPDAARLHGRSWRYWAEAAASRQSQDLLASNLPLLLALGQADPLIPPQAAAQLQQRFAAAGKQNLTLLEYPQADHGLSSPQRNFLPDFMHSLERWLALARTQQSR